MRSLPRSVLLAAVAAHLWGCDQEARLSTMRFDHYEVPCRDAGPRFCLQVLDSSDLAVQPGDTIDPRRIAGFEHRPGVVSEVELLVDEGDEGVVYELVDVLGEHPVPVDARFVLRLGPQHVSRAGTNRLELVSNKQVVCHTSDVCHGVSEAMVEGTEFDLELAHPLVFGGSLVAYDVELHP